MENLIRVPDGQIGGLLNKLTSAHEEIWKFKTETENSTLETKTENWNLK